MCIKVQRTEPPPYEEDLEGQAGTMMQKRMLIFLLLGATLSAATEHNESLGTKKVRVVPQSSEVVHCLNAAFQVGCGAFACLENTTCETDGLYDICKSFLNSAAKFNTPGKMFVKESLKCIVNGINARIFLAVRRCSSLQKMISEVQEDCYTKLDICSVARSNTDAITEVLNIPQQFSNRYYNKLLGSLLACDDETVSTVKNSFLNQIGPNLARIFKALQGEKCPLMPPKVDFNRKRNLDPQKLRLYQTSSRGASFALDPSSQESLELDQK
uniref:Stanniocalcin 1 n=1 Tax=Leptobrachium leishanense TaxID=445787 RepID=A0A8C5MVL0_9ANUR